jgi:hypothetical protein
LINILMLHNQLFNSTECRQQRTMTLQFSLDHQSSVLSLKNLLLWYIYLSIWKYLINTKVKKKLEQKMSSVLTLYRKQSKS